MRPLVAGLSGALFSLGLNLSGMTQPLKIMAFLDLTGARTGRWDPSLLVVMGGALATHAALLPLIRRRAASWSGEPIVLPAPAPIDRRLVVGSLGWGAGWGLTGLCPGPILAAVGAGQSAGLAFFFAMLGGMALHEAWARRA